MGKPTVYVSFASCPPISMTSSLEIFAMKFVDTWAPAQIVKPS